MDRETIKDFVERNSDLKVDVVKIRKRFFVVYNQIKMPFSDVFEIIQLCGKITKFDFYNSLI